MSEQPRFPARHVIGIASGKGGVGKSTVALNLACALAETGAAVGVLDADIYGPDIPRMMGLTRTSDATSITLASIVSKPLDPVEHWGMHLMSAQFLIGESQAISMPAVLLEALLHRLFWGVRWPELDYLVVDLPPGTGDIQQQLFKQAPASSVVVVVTPQDVAHLDARKLLTMLAQSGIRVLGGVENLTVHTCPHCGHDSRLFPEVPASRSVWAAGVDRLASLPHAPEILSTADEGRSLLLDHPAAPPAEAFRRLAGIVRDALDSDEAA